MKLTILLVALVGCVAAASVHKDTHVASKDFLAQQKFLFEIVYRIEDPLMFEEYIKLGSTFVLDKSHYTQFDFHMEKFYDAYKHGALLPKGEFFGALAKTHYQQAFGLFNFFYYAKDFETFMHNVCWARMHVNEGMFFYALNLAVIHRDDFHGLMLPAIHEIFPQHFFNSKFIYQAEKFDYDVWSKLIMYEKEFKDVLYKDNMHTHEHYNYFYTKDWKTWQWWKMMGLGEHWYAEDKFMLRENSNHFNQNPMWFDILKDVNMVYMPVDYTRELGFFSDHTPLSYFTEDVGWNAYWYYLNMDYSFFLDGHTFGLENDRRGEWWIYNVQQILARYYMERVSHGYGDIPEFSFNHPIEYGYNPNLIAYNGVGFTYRKNYWEIEHYGNYDMMNKVQNFFQRLYDIIDTGYYKTADGTFIDFRKPESIEYIGSMLQGNIDTFDKYFFNYYYLLCHMYFGNVDYTDMDVLPNVFLNFETMMRDPMFYTFYKQFTNVFYHFKYYLAPYTHEELNFPGVTIKNVVVDDLVTYFDIVDFDVTNLLNDKMVFHDNEFVWDKTLLARQSRLNHKPFTFDYTIESDKSHKVVIRTFMAPKFDEFGAIITLADNRENFVEIDEFVYTLVAGTNTFKRNSKDFYWTVEDHSTYTELYQYVMSAYEGKYEYPVDFTEPHCGFPDRLLLPHGSAKGMPMQFFYFVTPYTADQEQFTGYDQHFSCGIGSGHRHVDNAPFGYPFDRVVDEFEFFVPNMYFQDVKVYHEDKFEKYFDGKYENYGHFDYTYM